MFSQCPQVNLNNSVTDTKEKLPAPPTPVVWTSDWPVVTAGLGGYLGTDRCLEDLGCIQVVPHPHTPIQGPYESAGRGDESHPVAPVKGEMFPFCTL